MARGCEDIVHGPIEKGKRTISCLPMAVHWSYSSDYFLQQDLLHHLVESARVIFYWCPMFVWCYYSQFVHSKHDKPWSPLILWQSSFYYPWHTTLMISDGLKMIAKLDNMSMVHFLHGLHKDFESVHNQFLINPTIPTSNKLMGNLLRIP